MSFYVAYMKFNDFPYPWSPVVGRVDGAPVSALMHSRVIDSGD